MICMSGTNWSREAEANFRAGSFQNHLQLWEDLFCSECPAPTDSPGKKAQTIQELHLQQGHERYPWHAFHMES